MDKKKKIEKMSFQEIMKLPQAERLFIKNLRWSLIKKKKIEQLTIILEGIPLSHFDSLLFAKHAKAKINEIIDNLNES